MNHFYQDIKEESYFSFSGIYRRMVEKYPSGSTFVEVGVLHGMSLAFLGVEIVNSGKDIKLFGVDNFRWHDKQYSIVLKNLAPLGDRIRIVQSDSAEASRLFDDRSVDFVFIDATHEYEAGMKDIAAWLPKMRSGGTIAGHDYSPDSFPGLVRAVDECFAGRFSLSEGSVWEVVV